MSHFKVCPLYICFSILSFHARINKLLDTSRSSSSLHSVVSEVIRCKDDWNNARVPFTNSFTVLHTTHRIGFSPLFKLHQQQSTSKVLFVAWCYLPLSLSPSLSLALSLSLFFSLSLSLSRARAENSFLTKIGFEIEVCFLVWSGRSIGCKQFTDWIRFQSEKQFWTWAGSLHFETTRNLSKCNSIWCRIISLNVNSPTINAP